MLARSQGIAEAAVDLKIDIDQFTNWVSEAEQPLRKRLKLDFEYIQSESLPPPDPARPDTPAQAAQRARVRTLKAEYDAELEDGASRVFNRIYETLRRARDYKISETDFKLFFNELRETETKVTDPRALANIGALAGFVMQQPRFLVTGKQASAASAASAKKATSAKPATSGLSSYVQSSAAANAKAPASASTAPAAPAAVTAAMSAEDQAIIDELMADAPAKGSKDASVPSTEEAGDAVLVHSPHASPARDMEVEAAAEPTATAQAPGAAGGSGAAASSSDQPRHLGSGLRRGGGKPTWHAGFHRRRLLKHLWSRRRFVRVVGARRTRARATAAGARPGQEDIRRASQPRQSVERRHPRAGGKDWMGETGTRRATKKNRRRVDGLTVWRDAPRSVFGCCLCALK